MERSAMMLQAGYTQKDAWIELPHPAQAMSAVSPKEMSTSLGTVSSPVLPRQHGHPSSAITNKGHPLVAVLTKTMHFSRFATSEKLKNQLIKDHSRQSLQGHLNHTTPDYLSFSPCQPNSLRRLLSPPTILCLIYLTSSPAHGGRTGGGGIYDCPTP